jgi:hypothetical protein
LPSAKSIFPCGVPSTVKAFLETFVFIKPGQDKKSLKVIAFAIEKMI